MEHNATEHGVTFTRTGIDALLNADEEADVVEPVSLEELSGAVAGLEDVVSEDPEQDTSLGTDGLYSVDEALKGVAVASAFLGRSGLLNEDLLKHRECI